MSDPTALHAVTDLLALLPLSAPVDEAPEPEEVKAGWTAFGIFGLLVLAVALLGWGLTKQLRRADDNRRQGLFGDVPEEQPLDPRAEERAQGPVEDHGEGPAEGPADGPDERLRGPGEERPRG